MCNSFVELLQIVFVQLLVMNFTRWNPDLSWSDKSVTIKRVKPSTHQKENARNIFIIQLQPIQMFANSHFLQILIQNERQSPFFGFYTIATRLQD